MPLDVVTFAQTQDLKQNVHRSDVRVATAAALPANSYSGIAFTASSNGALVIDGVSVAAGDRVLVKDQTSAQHNGIFKVTQPGDGSHPWILTRAADMVSTGQLVRGRPVLVGADGALNAISEWILIPAAIPATLDTTSLSFYPLYQGKQAANVKTAWNCPAGASTPSTLTPCPLMLPGKTKLIMGVSVQFKPLSSCSLLVPSINQVDASGNVIGNIGFWLLDQPIVGNWDNFVATWPYDPRLTHIPPDVDLGDGAGKYIGLNITPTGGDCTAGAAHIFELGFAMESITIDDSSPGFLSDVN
jgi:hypothetical protein